MLNDVEERNNVMLQAYFLAHKVINCIKEDPYKKLVLISSV